MTELVEALVKSPRLRGYVEELQQLLAKESARRERFYEDANGTIRSEIVTGFEIPVRAIFDARLNLTALTNLVSS
jgi:hypothetical protein